MNENQHNNSSPPDNMPPEYLGDKWYSNAEAARDYQDFVQNQREIIGSTHELSGTPEEIDDTLARQRELYHDKLFELSAQGQKAKEEEAKIERFRNDFKGRGEKALQSLIEKHEQRIADLRQEFEDSMQVATPEDEEAYANYWQKSQDELGKAQKDDDQIISQFGTEPRDEGAPADADQSDEGAPADADQSDEGAPVDADQSDEDAPADADQSQDKPADLNLLDQADQADEPQGPVLTINSDPKPGPILQSAEFDPRRESDSERITWDFVHQIVSEERIPIPLETRRALKDKISDIEADLQDKLSDVERWHNRDIKNAYNADYTPRDNGYYLKMAFTEILNALIQIGIAAGTNKPDDKPDDKPEDKPTDEASPEGDSESKPEEGDTKPEGGESGDAGEGSEDKPQESPYEKLTKEELDKEIEKRKNRKYELINELEKKGGIEKIKEKIKKIRGRMVDIFKVLTERGVQSDEGLVGRTTRDAAWEVYGLNDPTAANIFSDESPYNGQSDGKRFSNWWKNLSKEDRNKIQQVQQSWPPDNPQGQALRYWMKKYNLFSGDNSESAS